jgi:hypothetical protein
MRKSDKSFLLLFILKGFNLVTGEPKVGRLLSAAWSFTEAKTFAMVDGPNAKVPESSSRAASSSGSEFLSLETT